MTASKRSPISRLSVSDAGLDLITEFEGFVAYPYYDLAVRGGKYEEWKGGPERHPTKGLVTIGYGHTNLTGLPPEIVPGMRMTKAEAFDVLKRMLNDKYAPAVRKAIGRPLHQHEFDALVSFAYNLGPGRLDGIASAIKAGDFDKVPAIMLRYTKARQGGKLVELRGLVRRRRAEAEMWRGLRGAAPSKAEIAEARRTPETPATKTPLTSTTNISALVAGTTGGTTIAAQINEGLRTAGDLWETVSAVGPWVLAAVVLAVAVWWIIKERNRKLREDGI